MTKRISKKNGASDNSNGASDSSNGAGEPSRGAGEPGQSTGEDFLVVGLGASAGGIKAFKEFFAQVPPQSGMAYVVILHLSPEHESHLAEVLQTATGMPVTQVQEAVKIEPDHVYVISPNRSLTMNDGHLAVSEIKRIEERRAPVDIFFRTLAESKRERAVCVILSGTGPDGSMGMKRVKEQGGICLVQDPQEAEYSEMPRNSMATGLVDLVLPVAEMPGKIIAYKERVGSARVSFEAEEPEPTDESALRQIFTQLRVRTGHDFTNYKRATVLRRIERRININELPDLTAYADFIRERPEEAQSLLKDLLISVTNFFRDPESFQTLERDFIAKLFAGKKAGDQVRVWVAGCATGEEAYTFAMLLCEFAANLTTGAPAIQVFATDIDETAIATAREGFYSATDVADISPERLRRYLTQEPGGYRVRRELRELVLFAHHNLIKDPPFSHLDLVSCRNLLIYLNRAAQERVMQVFHFALNPGGFMFLGTSESVDGSASLFLSADKEARIYQSRALAARLPLPPTDLSIAKRGAEVSRRDEGASETRALERLSYADLHQRLVEQYIPPSVVVNEEYDIVHLSERAGRYLRVVGGEPSHNLLRLVRPELRMELRTALHQAVQSRQSVEARGVPVQIEDRALHVNLIVRPVFNEADNARGFILVVFEEAGEGTDDGGRAHLPEAVATAAGPVARQLEDELVRVKAQLRSTVEQYETQTEELKASNEELQAMNEELRSTAEELETSKEELQSINEELTTVNQELKVKIEELGQANNDFRNLMNSTDIGTIFLDRALCLKLFTPRSRDIFNLIPADVGRPLSDIKSQLNEADLLADLERVLASLQPVQREVETREGRWYLLNILPYRTADDRINGVVLTFLDVTERNQGEAETRRLAVSLERQTRIFNTTLSSINDFVYLFDREGRFIYSNQPLLDLLGITPAEIVGKNFFDLSYPHDLAARLQEQIQRVFDTKQAVRGETPFTSPTGAGGFYEYIFTPVLAADGATVEVVAGSTRNITERKRAELNVRFLAATTGDLARLTTPDEIMRTIGAEIGAYLDLSVCAFMEINEAADEAVVTHDWHREGARGLVGKYRIGEFLTGEFQRASRAGEVFVVRDTKSDLRAGAEQYAAIDVGSFVSVPIVRDGEWRFLIVMFDASAHDWRADEIELLRELTARIWTRLERARAEEALRDSEVRFRATFEQANVGIVQLSFDGQLSLVNPGFCNIIGYAEEECRGLTVRDITHADDYKLEEAEVKRLMAGEINGFTMEKRYLHKSGRTVWGTMTATLVRNDAGEPFYTLAIIEDISERKAAQEALRESEERLRLTMESVTDYAIITQDTEGLIKSWNVGAERVFGYTEAEARGQHVAVIFTPEDRAAGAPEWEMRTAREEGRAADERWHLRKNGRRFYVSGVLAPLYNGERLTGYAKIARDLTEQRRNEETLRRAHDELEQRVFERTRELGESNEALRIENAERRKVERARLELLRQLVRVQDDERRRIARDIHDHLGQQSTALRLNLESLKEQCRKYDELCEAIAQTQLIAARLDADVDFLAWELRPAALDDLGLAASLANFVREWSRHFNIAADFHSTGMDANRPAPEVEINLYRIAQEALNNICKHAGASRVDVLLERRDGSLVLIVEDNGAGFDSHAQEPGDRGLGLLGMRERAGLVGGALEIETAPGEGTTIFARVPVVFPQEGSIEP